MFENILRQKRVISFLKEDIASGRLPSSLLFYGEPYSGKLSTALELARVLSCSAEGNWNCSCRSCREYRSLTSQYLLMTGGRYFYEEIAASGDTMYRNPSPATTYLYIRSVRKLLRRFDAQLWEGNEAKLKSVRGSVEALAASVDELEPGESEHKRSDLEKIVKSNASHVEKICGSSVSKNIPIDQIRNITYWCRSLGGKHPKFVLLEGVENMVDSSRNALLKLLEEPPENCYLILLTSRKGGIIQTILSRVRQYSFSPRDLNASEEVLRRIFRIEDTNQSLRHFFLSWKGVRTDQLADAAERVITTILEGGRYEIEAFDELIKQYASAEQFEPFLEELTSRLSALLAPAGTRKGFPLSPELIAEWNGYIREAYVRRSAYNQSGSLLLESLLYRMAESIEKERSGA